MGQNEMLMLSTNQKEIVERQFISFLKKTIYGTKLDYHKQEKQIRSKEILVPSYHQFFNIEEELIPDAIYFDLQLIKKELNDNQLMVLEIVLMQGKTEKEASKVLNLSQQGINVIKKQVIRIIKEKLEVENYE